MLHYYVFTTLLYYNAYGNSTVQMWQFKSPEAREKCDMKYATTLKYNKNTNKVK